MIAPQTYGDNAIVTGDVTVKARRGGVATYAPVFSTTKITGQNVTSPDPTPATPSAPTSASGSGVMAPLAGSNRVLLFVVLAVAAVVAIAMVFGYRKAN